MENTFKYDINCKLTCHNLSANLLKNYGTNIPIIICLGSDKVLSDMVGVLVADKLKKQSVPTLVFGGSNNPIGANQLDILISKLKCKNILYIDSCLARQKNQLYFSSDGITLKNGKKYIGASIGAGTIFAKSNRVLLAETKYTQVIEYVENITQAICNYFHFVKLVKNYK